MKKFKEGPFTAYVSDKFPDVTMDQLISVLNIPSVRTGSLLGGRGVVTFTDLEKIGSVVLKHYCRGGLLGKVVKEKYLRFLQTRPAHEFKVLEKALCAGINVPEPIAWIVKGDFFYSGWLLMKKIDYDFSLADTGQIPESELTTILQALSSQIELLIKNRIYHIDLHPGNVLVDKTRKVYLIDFDKAKFFKGALNDLRDEYLCRWRRAILKHELPDFLAEQVCASLRSNFKSRAI
jgi:3-deoxy-D-manno-octulosonic acid kinase